MKVCDVKAESNRWSFDEGTLMPGVSPSVLSICGDVEYIEPGYISKELSTN
jgi:hypothetical protein